MRRVRSWAAVVGNCLGIAAGIGLITGPAAAQTTAGSATTIVVPITAQTASFVSESTVYNPNALAISVGVTFYEANNSAAPGPKACADLAVPALRAAQFTLASQCGIASPPSHFGILVLTEKSGSKPIYGFVRTQNPLGIGFSIEGFPAGNFNDQVSHTTGLKKTTAGLIYQTNCFVGSLAQPVSYTLKLFNGATNAQIGTTISGNLGAYEQYRYLDVFGPTGVNAPAGDQLNVRAEFASNPPATLVGFCTVQDNTSFGADFRIAKSYGQPGSFVQGGNAFAATAILGTTDNNALDIRVNGSRAMRFEPNAISPNVIGGHPANSATPGVRGATIGGGGVPPGDSDPNYPAEGPNRVTDSYGVVGGGYNNRAGDDAGTIGDRPFAAVVGGLANVAAGDTSFVGGGYNNVANGRYATIGGGASSKALGDYGAVGGGANNSAGGVLSTVGGGTTNTASGPQSTVAGGFTNVASLDFSTVSGGGLNTAGGYGSAIGGGAYNDAFVNYVTIPGGFDNNAGGSFSTIGGGFTNAIGDGAGYSTIAGGQYNVADGDSSTVGGGANNKAHQFKSVVAGGYLNTASFDYSFVGGGKENTSGNYGSVVAGGANNVAAGVTSQAGGYYANANYDGCYVWGDFSTSNTISCNSPNRYVVRSLGGVFFFAGGSTQATYTGVALAPGGTAWVVASDRNIKENVSTVDTSVVLERLVAMPIASWNLKAQDPSIRHLGPMAQDFRAAFGLGETELGINTIDADGVALAAIKGLNDKLEAKVAEQAREIAFERIARELQAREIAQLRERVAQAEVMAADVMALKAAVAEMKRERAEVAAH